MSCQQFGFEGLVALATVLGGETDLAAHLPAFAFEIMDDFVNMDVARNLAAWSVELARLDPVVFSECHITRGMYLPPGG
ncbi:hypothetical protein BRAO285_850064 [Bradyrhizobium sp. ORS 285]|nr:hypothetical protein BRAO285_850064 [Bradyrhizobium sp. ORS 285]